MTATCSEKKTEWVRHFHAQAFTTGTWVYAPFPHPNTSSCIKPDLASVLRPCALNSYSTAPWAYWGSQSIRGLRPLVLSLKKQKKNQYFPNIRKLFTTVNVKSRTAGQNTLGGGRWHPKTSLCPFSSSVIMIWNKQNSRSKWSSITKVVSTKTEHLWLAYF